MDSLVSWCGFTAWLGFFIFQSALVRTSNVKLHRMTGWFGAALGVLMPVLGISTAIIMHRFEFIHFHAEAVRLPPTGANPTSSPSRQSISCRSQSFSGWPSIGAKMPEYHRRLMLVATCALTAAAFGRLPMIPYMMVLCGCGCADFAGRRARPDRQSKNPRGLSLRAAGIDRLPDVSRCKSGSIILPGG